jgi:beta-N-acetylhexosaminidase
VAADQEGGSVQRYKSVLSPLPSAEEAGAGLSPDRLIALGRIMGRQLALVGCSLNLAPLAEAGRGAQAFSRGRYYSDDPLLAAERSGAFLRGMQESLACAAKHFPAMTDTDPHKALPRLDCDPEEFRVRYLEPFKRIAVRDGAAAIMVSHVLVPALDPELPASLSPALISLALRKEAGFKGLVLTDDLGMAALASYGPPSRTAVLAIGAGADMVMVLEAKQALLTRDALAQAVREGRLGIERVRDACVTIIALKIAYGLLAEPAPYSASKLEALKADAATLLAE